jgi:hypothetical protein
MIHKVWLLEVIKIEPFELYLFEGRVDMVRYVLFCIFVPNVKMSTKTLIIVKNQMENDSQSPVMKRRLRLIYFPVNCHWEG